MPFIAGQAEQKAALKRVKDNLAEVERINDSLLHIKEYVEQATESEYRMECKFVMPDESLKRIKIPFVVDNVDFLVDALKKHKDTIVKCIKEDTAQFHISLDPKEEMMLMGEKPAEK